MRKTLVFLVLFSAVLSAWGGRADCPPVPETERQVRAIDPEVQIAVVPGITKVYLGYRIHTVLPGDNIWSLSRKYTTLDWMIRKDNPHIGQFLWPGQKVKIPLVAWKQYQGKASWYGPGFHRKRMASGERYDQNAILIAHRHWPIGLRVRVTNLDNGRSIIAEVKDRGPFVETDIREVDLSYGAAKALGSLHDGVVSVRIEPLNSHLAKWVSGYDRVI